MDPVINTPSVNPVHEQLAQFSKQQSFTEDEVFKIYDIIENNIHHLNFQDSDNLNAIEKKIEVTYEASNKYWRLNDVFKRIHNLTPCVKNLNEITLASDLYGNPPEIGDLLVAKTAAILLNDISGFSPEAEWFLINKGGEEIRKIDTTWYDTEEVKNILKICPKLQEISINLNDLELIDPIAPQIVQLDLTIPHNGKIKDDDFASKLTSLKTLNITCNGSLSQNYSMLNKETLESVALFASKLPNIESVNIIMPKEVSIDKKVKKDTRDRFSKLQIEFNFGRLKPIFPNNE